MPSQKANPSLRVSLQAPPNMFLSTIIFTFSPLCIAQQVTISAFNPLKSLWAIGLYEMLDSLKNPILLTEGTKRSLGGLLR